MNKKNIFLLTIILISSVSTLSIKGNSDTVLVPLTLTVMPTAVVDLGPSMFVEFNRSIMQDDQAFAADDEIWFGFSLDIADDTLFSDGDLDSFANQWYHNESDSFGVYNITRFQGKFNVYLDNIDLGLSNVGQFWGFNTTQDIAVTLEEGWHILTIIAGEVVSDQYRTSFQWEWAKDSTYFYVSEELDINPPERKQASNFCNVKSYPTDSADLVNHFDWDWTDIRVAVEFADNDVSTLSQTLLRSADDASVEVNYNYSTYPLALSEDEGYVVFQSLQHLGPGISFWWANDGVLTQEEEFSLQLIAGTNYVYFAAIGMKPHYTYFDFDVYQAPTVEINSKIFTIYNDVSGASYGTFSVILGIFALAAIVIVLRKRK